MLITGAYLDTARILALKLLQILDLLVDLGDRRSAALQQGEIFREIQLTPQPI